MGYTMDTHQLAIAAAGLLTFLVILRRIQYAAEVWRFKRQHGYEAAPRFAHADPILGLDLFRKFKKNAAERKALESMTQRALTEGHTRSLSVMGMPIIMTCEPENV
jgi:hypothetical protein